MSYPISLRSTQNFTPTRFPVIEFEPLLDAIEAAALFPMQPKSLRKKARLNQKAGVSPGDPVCKGLLRVRPASRHVKDFLHEGEPLSNPSLLHRQEIRAHGRLPSSIHRVRFNSIPNHVEFFLQAHVKEQELVAAKDRVLGDARRLQQSKHLRPHRGVIPVVGFAGAWFQSQKKSNSLQSETSDPLCQR